VTALPFHAAQKADETEQKSLTRRRRISFRQSSARRGKADFRPSTGVDPNPVDGSRVMAQLFGEHR
jgi:hypothetical protein